MGNRFQVTYNGDGVVSLPGAGLFQGGTSAVVGEAAAASARAHGGFAIEEISDGKPAAPAAPATSKPAEVEAKKEAPKEAPKAEAPKKDDKPADKPAETAPADKT